MDEAIGIPIKIMLSTFGNQIESLFLLYNRIYKAPISAIEVDGVSYHNNELQRDRDEKKDHIIEVIGLPILRLSTDGYNGEAKIIENITNAIGYSCVATS